MWSAVRFIAICVVLLQNLPLPSAAQQPSGPATLEQLSQADQSATTPVGAKTDAANAGQKRPAGTLARPKESVQHPDLDKAWAEYDAAVLKAAEGIRTAIAKQFDAATEKGDLDAAEKWQAAAEQFDKAGALPAHAETKAMIAASVVEYRRAKDELAKAYEAVVKSLTMEKKIAEAKRVRDEWTRNLTMTHSKEKDERSSKAESGTEGGRRPTLPAGSHFVGMIGRYRMGNDQLPFVMLSVPSGSNVFSDTVKSHMNGKVNLEPGRMSFEATALLPIDKDGSYLVTAERACSIAIAGNQYDLSNYSKKNGAVVLLKKGLHDIRLSVGNNGGQLPSAAVEVRDASTGKLVPIVIARPDIEAIIEQQIAEVSGWRPFAVRVKADLAE